MNRSQIEKGKIVRLIEDEDNGIVFLYNYEDRVESLASGNKGEEWEVVQDDYRMKGIIGVSTLIEGKNILLRNCYNPQVWAIAQPHHIIGYHASVNVDELGKAKTKWKGIQTHLNEATRLVATNCSYCEQFKDWAGGDNNAPKCPLMEVCGACRSDCQRKPYKSMCADIEEAGIATDTIVKVIEDDIKRRKEVYRK